VLVLSSRYFQCVRSLSKHHQQHLAFDGSLFGASSELAAAGPDRSGGRRAIPENSSISAGLPHRAAREMAHERTPAEVLADRHSGARALIVRAELDVSRATGRGGSALRLARKVPTTIDRPRPAH
jgi:hypothetical protein